MPLSIEEWRRITQQSKADTLALTTVQSSLPAEWMRMSPHDLMQGAAVIAMHYDRHRMADALRNRVIFQDHPELPPQIADMPDAIRDAFVWFQGQVEATMLTLADQIENGTLGHAD